MVILTEKAKNKLNFFTQDRDRNEWGLRIKNEGGPTFHFALERTDTNLANDSVFTVEGYKIIVDPITKKKIENATLDFVDAAWGAGFKMELNPQDAPPTQAVKGRPDFSNPTIKKINDILINEINPAIASHGGYTELLDYQNGTVYLRMGGGCQGCAMSMATLRNGIEMRLKEEVPEIISVIDQTDHAEGKNPFYQSS